MFYNNNNKKYRPCEKLIINNTNSIGNKYFSYCVQSIKSVCI